MCVFEGGGQRQRAVFPRGPANPLLSSCCALILGPRRSKDSAARAEAVAFFSNMPEEVLKLEDLVVEGLSHVLAYLR